MNGEIYLLDTSAIIALVEAEEGADRVKALLREQEVLLPWPVLMETYYTALQERGQAEADQRYGMLLRAATILWEMHESTLLLAARLKASHRLSFADALIAAYAMRQGAVLVHKDPEYESLAGEVSLEALPYKGNAGR